LSLADVVADAIDLLVEAAQIAQNNVSRVHRWSWSGIVAEATDAGNQHVDLVRLGELHHLLALEAIILGARVGLLEDADDVVASALGEGAQVSFLAGARLIVGRNPAVDRWVAANREHCNG
jgi:hypothetical protein